MSSAELFIDVGSSVSVIESQHLAFPYTDMAAKLDKKASRKSSQVTRTAGALENTQVQVLT